LEFSDCEEGVEGQTFLASLESDLDVEDQTKNRGLDVVV
jgi:hypothetical protein